MSKRKWTKEEDKILEEGCILGKTSKEISNDLTERTYNAVDLRIRYLGLNKIYNRSKLNDLTGKMFGNWKVLHRIDDYISPSGYHQTQYICECQCINKTLRPQLAINLTRGKTKSCGCLLGENISESKKSSNTFDLSGGYGIGYTENGEEFYFDKEDYDLIKEYKWHLDKSGYVVACVKGTTIKMHRIVMGVTDSNIQVDHIKHRVNDNRKAMLRLVNQVNNSRNKRLLDSNTSGSTGVYFNRKRNRWIAQICCNGKVDVIGSFINKKDAIEARKVAEEEYFGEYSYRNSMNFYLKNE